MPNRKNKLSVLKDAFSIIINFCQAGFSRFLRKKGIIENNFEDVLVISYPKSGRTWLRVMLDHLNINLQYDHDDANIAYHPTKEFQVSEVDSEKYRDKKVIFILRDPRDVVVSSYFQAVKRQNAFDGTISEFIKSSKFGIKKIIEFQTKWVMGKDVPADFLLVRYEAMHKDTVQELKNVLFFLGIKGLSHRKLKKTVALFTFDNMQYFEKKGLFRMRYGRRLKPKDAEDKDSFKVRRGVVGGYVDYLSEEDIQYCNKWIEQAPIGYQ